MTFSKSLKEILACSLVTSKWWFSMAFVILDQPVQINVKGLGTYFTSQADMLDFGAKTITCIFIIYSTHHYLHQTYFKFLNIL